LTWSDNALRPVHIKFWTHSPFSVSVLQVSESVVTMLPTQTQLTGCTGWGIIGSDVEGIPREIEDECSVSLMLLRLPGTRVSSFSPKLGADFTETMSPEQRRLVWSRLTRTPVDSPDAMNAMMLSAGDQALLAEFEDLFPTGMKVGGFVSGSRNKKKYVLGGGQVRSSGSSFLTFSGRAKLNVVVVGHKQVEQSLASLPQGRSNLAGFLFSCVGRGSGYHGKGNVEADAFRKAFPGLPLIGFFTGGELGPEEGGTTLTRYSYTSIFCVLSTE